MTEFDIAVADGRAIRVREAGDPRGFPVFVHHGTPMAGTLFELWVANATARGLRLITHDRPGYGGSDRLGGRAVAHVASDVAAIADELGLGRFATWGISGGGPHALACAALLPDRVTAAASLAGIAPWDAEGLDVTAGMGEDNVKEFGLATTDPDTLRELHEQWRAEMLSASPEDMFKSLESILSDVDKGVLTGDLARFLHDSGTIALADGIDGWFDDDLSFVKNWGFDLRDIDVPVLLWQGEQDLMVPFAHGEWLAERIPGCDARLSPEEGHLTLLVTRVPATHEWLLTKT